MNGAARTISAAVRRPFAPPFPTRRPGSEAETCRAPWSPRIARFTFRISTISIPRWPIGRVCRLRARPAPEPFPAPRCGATARQSASSSIHRDHLQPFTERGAGTAAEFRRPSRHRYRERAAVRRNQGSAGATDAPTRRHSLRRSIVRRRRPCVRFLMHPAKMPHASLQRATSGACNSMTATASCRRHSRPDGSVSPNSSALGYPITEAHPERACLASEPVSTASTRLGSRSQTDSRRAGAARRRRARRYPHHASRCRSLKDGVTFGRIVAARQEVRPVPNTADRAAAVVCRAGRDRHRKRAVVQ